MPECVLRGLYGISVLHQQAKDFDLRSGLEPVVGEDALKSRNRLLLAIRGPLELLEREKNREPRLLKIDFRHSRFDFKVLELLVDRLPVVGERLLV